MRAIFIFYFVLVSCVPAMSQAAMTLPSVVNPQAVWNYPGPPRRHSVSDTWDVCCLSHIHCDTIDNDSQGIGPFPYPRARAALLIAVLSSGSYVILSEHSQLVIYLD